MTTFRGNLEMMPSRKDGCCSRCTRERIERGVKPFKAKWRVFSPEYAGGRVMLNGSPAEPWTMEEYKEMFKTHGGISEAASAAGTKYVDWLDVCGHCRRQWTETRIGAYGETKPPLAEIVMSLADVKAAKKMDVGQILRLKVWRITDEWS